MKVYIKRLLVFILLPLIVCFALGVNVYISGVNCRQSLTSVILQNYVEVLNVDTKSDAYYALLDNGKDLIDKEYENLPIKAFSKQYYSAIKNTSDKFVLYTKVKMFCVTVNFVLKGILLVNVGLFLAVLNLYVAILAELLAGIFEKRGNVKWIWKVQSKRPSQSRNITIDL